MAATVNCAYPQVNQRTADGSGNAAALPAVPAVVDGATPWQVFTRVLFPVMKAGYAVTGIFVFRIAWNEFILAQPLTDGTPRIRAASAT